MTELKEKLTITNKEIELTEQEIEKMRLSVSKLKRKLKVRSELSFFFDYFKTKDLLFTYNLKSDILSLLEGEAEELKYIKKNLETQIEFMEKYGGTK